MDTRLSPLSPPIAATAPPVPSSPGLPTPASFSVTADQTLMLVGCWRGAQLADIGPALDALSTLSVTKGIDAGAITGLDTAGALLLESLSRRLKHPVLALPAAFAGLLDAVSAYAASAPPVAAAPTIALAPVPVLGRAAVQVFSNTSALLSFVGESSLALAACLADPRRLRWRAVAFNIRTAGFDAMAIVGLLAFLLGVVVTYQGSNQLRRYGANIFVVDLVGLAMLREFAPLITAIIVAGRSGSAYAAQIGTMQVTEEVDAMRTLGLPPLELLVLPKLLALVVALPLLTFLADALGVAGGMLMAKAQLGVSFGDFLERFTKVISPTSLLLGLAKAPVFAVLIVIIGCFQGFRTRGGADSVGRQTTRSVVQSTVAVIVADALFSVAFSALDL